MLLAGPALTVPTGIAAHLCTVRGIAASLFGCCASCCDSGKKLGALEAEASAPDVARRSSCCIDLAAPDSGPKTAPDAAFVVAAPPPSRVVVAATLEAERDAAATALFAPAPRPPPPPFALRI